MAAFFTKELFSGRPESVEADPLLPEMSINLSGQESFVAGDCHVRHLPVDEHDVKPV